jgi:sialate O-acetylesterase
MIHPILRATFRGVIWYQGEGNARHHEEYENLFKTLIRSWRADFVENDFPFYWVQLANRHHGRLMWVYIREAQTAALELLNTGQAIAIDIGERNETHARNKQDVGHRLARIALANTYGRDLVWSGPVFASVEREGTALRVRFEHAGDGLVARGGTVTALEVAGRDGRYVPAAGRIDGSTLVVTAPGIVEPKTVRYAWAEDPAANLYNAAGLPAAPFRSRPD